MNSMTPSQKAKELGLKSLAQASQMTGKHRKTLERWHKEQQELFEIVIRGCVCLSKDRKSELVAIDDTDRDTTVRQA